MDGWKDDLSREYKKGKRGTPGAWVTRSSVHIRDKRKHANKGQRRQERMYSSGVDYSTLSISSLTRHYEDTVQLMSPPTDATPDTEEAQTTAKGRGKEAPHNRTCAPCHHGVNAGGVNVITSGGNGEGTTGT
jgi:hypothetical protein